MRLRMIIAACAVLPLGTVSHAAVPTSISVQGRLTDAAGAPLPAGIKGFEFRIFDAELVGVQVWPILGSEVQNLTTDASGLWSTDVGRFVSLTESVFSDTTRWLQITVDGTTLPRVRLVTGPFAYRVSTVDGASGGTITSKLSIGPGHTNTGANAFVAGADNTVGGDRAAIGGGAENHAAGQFSVVGGGAQNTAGAIGTTVGGGLENTASAAGATVAGGEENQAIGDHAVVAGGALNSASGPLSYVGGGLQDSALGSRAAVGGGEGNVASGDWSTVVGGYRNTASGNASTVGGGWLNMSTGNSSSVGGGLLDSALGYRSTVGGGEANVASGDWSTVGGGGSNNATNYVATIAGGNQSIASGRGSTVGGGQFNRARGAFSVNSGGGGETEADSNSSSGDYSTVGGGVRNSASGYRSTIGGGTDNIANGESSTVAGGVQDSALGYRSAIGGGQWNVASGAWATVSGGGTNYATNLVATVSGGNRSIASGQGSTVSGGEFNRARGSHSVVAGGGGSTDADSNCASGDNSTVGGGQSNVASGLSSTIPGGRSNSATGDYAFAAGRRAKSMHDGSFVWADSTNSDFASTADNQFLIRASGGVGLGTNAPEAPLHVSEGSAGTVTAYTNAVAAFERNGNAYLHLLSPDADENGILFGTPTAALGGAVLFNSTLVPNGLEFRTNSNDFAVAINRAGSMGIGTTTIPNVLTLPNVASVDGRGLANAWSVYSSRRWKTKVTTIADPLKKVQRLRGVTFDWKADGRHDVGLIAEEVGEVIPEIVQYEANGIDAQSVDYSRLVALLIEGMKEQQKRIEALEKKLEQQTP